MGSTSFEGILGHLADPDRFSGGATAAALVGALATATTRLVVQVDMRRKANQAHLGDMQHRDAKLEQLATSLILLADEDAATLERLMSAYKSRKSDPDQYLDLLRLAAESTLTVADSITQLLNVIADELPRANRFIVSDLAAAATMANGAMGAIEMTCEINLQLLSEADGDETATSQQRERLSRLVHQAEAKADEIVQLSRGLLSRSRGQRS